MRERRERDSFPRRTENKAFERSLLETLTTGFTITEKEKLGYDARKMKV